MTGTALPPAPEVDFTHVSGVSWPRSGHHLLVRLLTGYFGPAFVYCEYHVGRPTDGLPEGCCRQAPCARPDRVTFSKNHDFGLDMPQVEGRRYLVQTRAFAPSVVSDFELAVRSGQEDSAASFRHFVSLKFSHYRDFMARWVGSDFARSPEVLQIPYETLVSEPATALAQAVRHLAPDHRPDPERLRAVIARVDGQKVADRKVHVLAGSGVHGARNVANFRYHTPELFDRIDRLALRREAVQGLFRRLLGRDPAEENMLGFQSHDSLEALESFIRSTPEFRRRQDAGEVGE